MNRTGGQELDDQNKYFSFHFLTSTLNLQYNHKILYIFYARALIKIFGKVLIKFTSTVFFVVVVVLPVVRQLLHKLTELLNFIFFGVALVVGVVSFTLGFNHMSCLNLLSCSIFFLLVLALMHY